MRPLFPHQQKALDWALKRPRIALLMEMRLGKTAVVIRWARSRGAQRILVIAPLSVLPGWEIELHLEKQRKVRLLRGNVKPGKGWNLVNYERVRAHPRLLQRTWDAIILDESTAIKNPQTQIAKLLLSRTRHIRLRAILSGLPAPESALDYFQQFAFLHGRWLGCRNYWEFRHRYFRQGWGWDWVPKANTRQAVRQALESSSFVLTRRAARIGPRKMMEECHVEMPTPARKLYRDIERYLATPERETKYQVVAISWLARLAGGHHPDAPHEFMWTAKARELLRLLREELKQEQVVVWCRFRREIETVSNVLHAAHISHGVLQGGMKFEKRRRLAKRFKAGRLRVMVSQLRVGKFGSLGLDAADAAIYYSNAYSMEDRYQSEDRIVSPQKRHPLLIIDLITHNTVDEEVVRILKEKKVESRSLTSRVVQELRRARAA